MESSLVRSADYNSLPEAVQKLMEQKPFEPCTYIVQHSVQLSSGEGWFECAPKFETLALALAYYNWHRRNSSYHWRVVRRRDDVILTEGDVNA